MTDEENEESVTELIHTQTSPINRIDESQEEFTGNSSTPTSIIFTNSSSDELFLDEETVNFKNESFQIFTTFSHSSRLFIDLKYFKSLIIVYLLVCNR